MDHTTCTVIGPTDWAASIGKKNSETSFEVQSHKDGERIATILNPTKYPEKIQSMLFSLYLGNHTFLNVQQVDRNFGETVIALDLMGKVSGSLAMGQLVDKPMLESIIKDTAVEGYEVLDPEPGVVREAIAKLPPLPTDGEPMVVVDQAFAVKGVGTVVLGFVVSGIIKKHMELSVCPGDAKTIVRSIQIHDKDHDAAHAGSRVGLALKNIDPDHLPRGSCLSQTGSPVVAASKIKARFRLNSHWKTPLEAGNHMHLWSSLQLVPALIVSAGEITDSHVELEVELELPIWLKPGERMGLVYLDSKSFRFFGSAVYE